MRLFVGVELPEDVRAALEYTSRAWRGLCAREVGADVSTCAADTVPFGMPGDRSSRAVPSGIYGDQASRLVSSGVSVNQVSRPAHGTYAAQPNFAHPSLYHITLCFLGEIAPGQVPHIVRCMRLVGDISPFPLRLGACGRFGGHDGQGIGWVGLAGEVGTLGALQARLEQELAAAGLPTDARAYRPHITLARKLRGSGVPPNPPPLAFSVNQITLFHSTRDARGQLAYIPLERMMLDGS